MFRLFFDVLLVSILVGVTVISGVLRRETLQQSQDRPIDPSVLSHLEQLPRRIGIWEERDTQHSSLLPGHLLEADAAHRRYVHQATGQCVELSLYAARGGAVWLDDAERLRMRFGSREFRNLRSVGVTIDGIPNSFWKTDLVNSGGKMQVWYSWSDGGAWTASRFPGITFAGRAYLYRLEISIPETSPGEDPNIEQLFLIDALPMIRTCLVVAPPQTLPRLRP